MNQMTITLKTFFRRHWLILLMLAGITLTYWNYAAIRKDDLASHAFQLLGEGFLAGHTHLSLEPPKELATLEDPYDPDQNRPYRTQDFSYYNGKYYLYFGPLPALTLWVPLKLLFGYSATDGVLMTVFAILGACCLTTLLYQLATHMQSRAHEWLIVIPPVIFGTWIPFILREPYFYETAVCAMFAYLSAGLLCLWRFIRTSRIRWLALASLSFGLAAGCRINHVFAALFLGLVFLYAVFYRKDQRVVKLLLAAGIPWALCIGGLAIYNYARFGSPFEIGARYMLTILGNQTEPGFEFMTTSHMLDRLYFHLFHLLPWKDSFEFPFFEPSLYEVWRKNYLYMWSLEPTYGLLTNSPFSLFFLGLFVDRATRRQMSMEHKLIIGGLALYGLINFTFMMFYFFLSLRYQVDFAPWIMTAGSLYYLHLLKQCKNPLHYRLLLAAGILLAAYSVFTGMASAYCSYTRCKA